MLIVACLLIGMLGTIAVWLVITGSRSSPAVPLVYRIPAVCKGPAGRFTVDTPSTTREISVGRNPS
jgi:hypothetical protein